MNSLSLRPAIISGSELLLNWRNAPLVRKSAFNTAEVLKEEHEMWFQNTMVDSDVRIYILESSCIPVGQIRINRVGAEVHDDTRMREDNCVDDPRVYRGDRPLPEREKVRCVLWSGSVGLGFERDGTPWEDNEEGAAGVEDGFRTAGHGNKTLQGHRIVADDAAL